MTSINGYLHKTIKVITVSSEDQLPYAPPGSDVTTVEANEEPCDTAIPLKGSPLKPRNLVALFTNPAHFFANHAWLSGRFEILIVAWMAGIVAVQERIDAKLMGVGASSDPSHTNFIVNSWEAYFIFSFLGGMVSAVILWFIAGWWYHARLELSGARNVAIAHARAAYQYQNFVQTLPAFAYALLIPLQYSSYSAYWYEDSGVSSLIILVFMYWSCVTSYRAAMTFPVLKWKAKIWFLILPVVFYTLVVGVISTIFAYLDMY